MRKLYDKLKYRTFYKRIHKQADKLKRKDKAKKKDIYYLNRALQKDFLESLKIIIPVYCSALQEVTINSLERQGLLLKENRKRIKRVIRDAQGIVTGIEEFIYPGSGKRR